MFSNNRWIDVTMRYAVLLLGLSLMSLGIALSIRSDLGTTPISSLPFVLSILSPLSVGTLMILMNLVFIVVQILILRRRFQPIQLLQIPVVVAFGLLNDAALWAVRDVTHDAYWQQWLIGAAGIILVGVGVGFQVKAKATPLAAEGLILALNDVLIRRFGVKRLLMFSSLKTQFDASLVLVSVIIALIFTQSLAGVREGTVAAALTVGLFAQLTIRILEPARSVERAKIRLVDSDADSDPDTTVRPRGGAQQP